MLTWNNSYGVTPKLHITVVNYCIYLVFKVLCTRSTYQEQRLVAPVYFSDERWILWHFNSEILNAPESRQNSFERVLRDSVIQYYQEKHVRKYASKTKEATLALIQMFWNHAHFCSSQGLFLQDIATLLFIWYGNLNVQLGCIIFMQ